MPIQILEDHRDLLCNPQASAVLQNPFSRLSTGARYSSTDARYSSTRRGYSRLQLFFCPSFPLFQQKTVSLHRKKKTVTSKGKRGGTLLTGRAPF